MRVFLILKGKPFEFGDVIRARKMSQNETCWKLKLSVVFEDD